MKNNDRIIQAVTTVIIIQRLCIDLIDLNDRIEEEAGTNTKAKSLILKAHEDISSALERMKLVI